MNVMSTRPSSNRDRAFNWLMLVGLIAIGLAVYSMVDYGNSTGKDEWRYVYSILVERNFLRGGGSPFKFILTYPFAYLFGIGFPAGRLGLVASRIAVGYLVFRLVEQLRPADRGFAVACGILAITFFVRDTFQFESIFHISESLAAPILGLLALVFLMASLNTAPEERLASLLLAGAAALVAWTSTRVREIQIPLLFALPVFWVVFNRWPRRDQLRSLAIWYVGVIVGTLPLALPILTGSNRGYSAKLFIDVRPERLLLDSIRQFDFAFRSFPLIPFDQIGAARPFLMVALVVVAAVLIAASRWLRRDPETMQSNWKADSLWVLGGLACTWLGFAAFLPTLYSRSGYHTHMMAQPAEAVVLTSILWLATAWIPRDRFRWAMRVLGVLLISVNGLVIARQLQVDLKYGEEATWENISSFMRTLGSIAPDSDGPIVFVYLENKPQEETPFVYGWGLQYAVRYFFEDRATGIHVDDSNTGPWEVRDDGIWFEELDRAQLYDWQHVLFITRTDAGQVLVLDTIPEQFASPERQAQYQPLAAIKPGYLPARIQETFPAVRPPDPVEE